MASARSPLEYVARSRSRFLSELAEFVRFPTVSASPSRRDDLRRCASWLAGHLRGIGLERASVLPTSGHPLVYGEWLRAEGRPTVLIYGHYDVQPADPLSAWRFPPFEPTVVGDDLFGRGASDDKGQIFAHVKGIESYLKSAGGLPVNVKFLIEGEEEIGSPSLVGFLSSNPRLADADVLLVSDTRFLKRERPAITYALRGLLTLELSAAGPGRDLHSGVYGGAFPNPLEALCEIVESLHDANGRVAIPGFYDAVRRVASSERTEMARVGPSDAQMRRDAMAERGWGEPDYSLYERTTIRPSLTIAGVTGGYGGPGVKAVIPSRAAAKVDVRLVPDQRPEEIGRLFRRHIARVAPPTVRTAVRTLSSAPPFTVDRCEPALRAASEAYRRAFGCRPVPLRLGGSIPAVGLLRERTGASTVLMGFGLPDDGIHSPNERFHLPNFYRGIEASIWFLSEVAHRKLSRRVA